MVVIKRFWWLLLIVVFIGVSYVTTFINGNIDLTKDKKFTLSPATENLLQNLKEPVEVEVFLTGNLSSGFKKLSLSTEALLQKYRSLSNGNLIYSFKKPGEGLSDSAKTFVFDSLMAMGIKPFNNQLNREEGETTEQVIFPSAIVKYNNKAIAIDLMSGKSGQDEEGSLNYSEALLEFKFDDAIDKLTRTNFPVVAYAVGNGEPLNPTIKDAINLLRTNYRLALFDLKNGILDADTVKALLIVKPSIGFSDNEKIKIDQYVMQGGKVVWFLDKLYAEFDSLLRSRTDFVAFDKNLNLDDLLFRFGVRINNDLLQDLNCAKQPLVVGNSGNQPQIQRIPFPYYPLVAAPQKKQHAVAKNLDQILTIFPSSLDTVQAKGIKKTILLSSDSNSRSLSTPAMVSLQSIKSQEDMMQFNKSFVPVGVLLEGNFTSLYANQFSPAMQDSIVQLTGVPFMPKAIKPSQQMVFSDADIITNVITESNETLAMGTQKFENYQFANRDFFLNCMDYLVGNAAIIETRNKDFSLRLLNKQLIKDQKTMWQFINIVLPLVLVIGVGLFISWYRKKQFV